jgi:nucleotidyltransferase substrate binding protein (TIGR01987 family)
MKLFDEFSRQTSNLALVSDGFIMLDADVPDAPEARVLGLGLRCGIVYSFEVVFDLACDVLGAMCSYDGIAADACGTPRGALKDVYACYDYLDDEKLWLSMLDDRVAPRRTRDEERLTEYVDHIRFEYAPELIRLRDAIASTRPDLLALP